MSDKIYCYPNTDVLKNKKNIKDKERLLQAEISYTSASLADLQIHPINGKFDFNHLCEIHRRIFQDLYTWAGKPRTVNIGKGNLFCLVQNIPDYAKSIFDNYYPDCLKAKNDPNKFIHTFTEHYADLNALHPFREGNGRSQREFARELCLQCGYIFDLTKTNHKEMLDASIEFFNIGNNTKLENIFKNAISPIKESPDIKQKLQSSIMTLSKDDIPIQTSHKKKMDAALLKFEDILKQDKAPNDDTQYE